MSGNAVLCSAVELVADNVANLQIIGAGEAEFMAFGISHFDGLLAVFMSGDDGGLGIEMQKRGIPNGD